MAETLGDMALFASVPDAALQEIEDKCATRTYQSGQEILRRDASTKDVFFVLEGRVRIVNYSSTGREIAYAVLSETEYFGELAAIDDGPRSASAVALGECRVVAMPPDVFRAVLARYNKVSFIVVQKLVAVIRACDDRIMDLATLSAFQRVYREFLKMAAQDPVTPDSWMVYPLPTQAQIASHASTTRETVARVISNLATQGIVFKKGRTLYIRDREALEQLAASDPKS